MHVLIQCLQVASLLERDVVKETNSLLSAVKD